MNAPRAGVVAAALALLAVGCGNDTDALTTSAARPEYGDYCAKSLAIETYPEPDFSQFESMTRTEQANLVKRFTGQLLPLGEALLAAAPVELKADGAIQLEALRMASRTGDPSGLETPEFRRAEAKTHSFDLANCGWPRADMVAQEYGFTDVPKSVPAGPLSIELTNEGKEVHDLTIFRVNDGTTESVKDILALPEAEAMKKITMAGSTFAEPGGSGYTVVRLEKGLRYGIACFVPLGEQHDGPPHLT